MKLNKYTLVMIAATAFSLQSCKKDFLDKEPFNQVIDIRDADGAERLMAGVYGGMYNDYHIWDYMVNGDVTSDNAYAGGDNPANIQIDLFTTNATNGNVGRDWSGLYSNIKNANEVLENIPNVEDAALTADRKAQMLGEAKTLRAYFYFHLVRLWGAVPLILKTPTNLQEMQQPRSTVDQVYTQIIKDLEEALPAVRTTTPNKGIISKGIVNALLAKVYASKPTPDWTKVNQYADAVIAGGYAPVSNFDHLFDGAHKNNSESIWEMQYDGWGGPKGRGNWMTGVIVGTGWKRFCTPTNDLVALFDAEGDVIRKATSISFRNVSTEGWSDIYWSKTNYPFINKYRNDDLANSYILRLADIKLLKAEALNELTAAGWSSAKTIVDEIRGRVNLGETPANDQTTMRLAIEKERRLELAFEGHRWFDLLRTNRAIAVMNAQRDGNGNPLNYNVTAAKLLFPIPQAERDRNPNL
mgnify:FL=1